MHRTIRDNLIRSIGGDVTLFAVLKTDDQTRNDDDQTRNGDKTISPGPARLQRILEEVGGGVQMGPRAIIKADDATSRALEVAQACYGNPPTNGTLYKLSSAIAQLHSRGECGRLIEADEGRRGSRFDWVVYARPDLMWYASIVPHCLWDTRHTTTKWDWVHISTRERAQRWLIDLPRNFARCNISTDQTYNATRSFSDNLGTLIFGRQGGTYSLAERGSMFQAEEILLGVRDAGPFWTFFPSSDHQESYNIPVALTREASDGTNHNDLHAQGHVCPAEVSPNHPFSMQANNNTITLERCMAISDDNRCASKVHVGLQSARRNSEARLDLREVRGL